MAEPTMVIRMGDEELRLDEVSAQEMVRVKTWTGLRNRAEWWRAISEEDPEALLAAYCLAKARKGEEVRYSEADFPLSSLDAWFVDDTGRQVTPQVEVDERGNVRLDEQGRPIPVLDELGRQRWVDKATGEPVPFDQTPSSTSLSSPLTPGGSSGFEWPAVTSTG